MMCRLRPQKSRGRRGATTVEMAVVVPVFGIFLAGIMEAGHAYMIVQTMNSAAKQGARVGAVDDRWTSDIEAKVDSIISAAFDAGEATVYIKDGSQFDAPGFNPSGINYAALPDIEVHDAQARQLYIVRIEVPYDEVAILPPSG